jgi:hypothetical protein
LNRRGLGNHWCVTAHRDPRLVVETALLAQLRTATTADAVAVTLEGLAVTYRRVADVTRWEGRSARLLDQATKLEKQAVLERSVALRLQDVLKG